MLICISSSLKNKTYSYIVYFIVVYIFYFVYIIIFIYSIYEIYISIY